MKHFVGLVLFFPLFFSVLGGPCISVTIRKVANKLLSSLLQIPQGVSKQLGKYKAYFQKESLCSYSLWELLGTTEYTNIRLARSLMMWLKEGGGVLSFKN